MTQAFDPNKMDKRLVNRFNEADEEFKQRQGELEKEHPDPSRPGSDVLLPANQQNKPAREGAHFSEKIYMFPESYNALRRELEENYKTFFETVVPGFGMSPAWAMAFSPADFIGFCNGALDMDVAFDTENVDAICKRFLNGFRVQRGLKPLNFDL